MSKPKLKEVPPALSPQRAPLAAAQEKVQEIREAIEATEKEIAEARAAIKEVETEIADAQGRLESARPLERAPHRRRLEAAQEKLGDLSDHLNELKQRGGHPPFVNDQSALPNQIKSAEETVRETRDLFMRDHPIVAEQLQHFAVYRQLLAQTEANLRSLPLRSLPQNWQAPPHEAPPQPDAKLVAWRDALLTDPAAELEE